MKTLICIALILAVQITSHACTTFCISTENELVFGKNYDWMIGYGLIFTNKKDIEKIAFVINDTPAKWKSKYGSVTFNQFGREFPSGGMNEAGLVVELMWLDGTEYPKPDDRAVVGGTLSWIQYQLDNSATIDEVIASDKLIRISQSSVPIHYLVADKNGKCMSVEFFDGKMVYHTGDNMPVKVLTNNTYKESAEYLKRHEGFGGNEKPVNDVSSLSRFVRACSMVNSYNPTAGQNAVDYGFNILNSVSQGNFTQWSIVYDIKNRMVYFKTLESSKIKNINLSNSDFSCSNEVKMIDINTSAEGNVDSQMGGYTYDANRKLIEDSYSNVDFLKKIPAESKDKAAKYPEAQKCANDMGTIDSPDKKKAGSNFILPLGITLGLIFLSVVIFAKYKNKRRT
jgi:penicillin V acylase-like amidase (Ntn superfamily)